jgi:menaquinone-9 beta-reductase
MNLTEQKIFDVAIAGGGLAGLTLAIQLKKMGHSVVLFEKEKYPFHRVCGEYISLESWPFLNELGIDTEAMHLPVIKKLIVSSPNGNLLSKDLPQGGFGISRFLLDHLLANIAAKEGVIVKENDKVNELEFVDTHFNLHASSGSYQSTVAIGCFGKRSNLDVKWARPFIKQKPSKLNNYIGVKYHINSDFPGDTIALHNFRDGYCGISKIEGDKYCLCYLTTAANLKKFNNSIRELEAGLLQKNPFLKKIFETSNFLYTEPLVISQISFDKKSQIENHVLMVGDAAGMITPLCGNGMSMAMHSGKIAAGLLDIFLNGKISRGELEDRYRTAWNKSFSGRLKAGRVIQFLFGKTTATNLFLKAMKPFPALISRLIKQTHGKPF